MNNKAFTLIELLIVVAIIGILAAIAVPNFLNAQTKAKIARVESDQKSMATALEMYFLDNNTYVEDHDFPSDPSQKGLFHLTSPIAYMSALPLDPFPSAARKNSEGNPHYEFGSGNYNGNNIKNRNVYINISQGPNLAEEVSGNNCFLCGNQNAFVRTFHISNGLNSAGDIIRYGGAFDENRIIEVF